MDRARGCDDPDQPLPYVRDLYRLIPEQRLAAILSRTALRQTAPLSAGRLRRLAGHRHGPVRRRLDPQGLAHGCTRPATSPSPPTRLSPRPAAGSASRRYAIFPRDRPPDGHPPDRRRLLPRLAADGPDGTTLDLPDTPENARRPPHRAAEGAFPQVRLLALCELGTHAICGLAIKPLRRGEPSMAGPLLDRLGPGSLLVWDRGFFSYELIPSVVRGSPTCWHG